MPESIYRLFNFPSGQFPKPAANVYMPEVKVRGTGTYGTVYCSDNLRSGDIVEMLSRGLSDITLQPFDAADITQSDNCYAEISKQLKDSPSEQLSWSKIKMNPCSPKIIVDLAYRGQILVSGKYRNYIPNNLENRVVYRINFDEKLSLSDLVDDSQIFKGPDWSQKHEALAWYQNHLHLFQRTKLTGWRLLTKIEDDTQNGAKLYSSMVYSPLSMGFSRGKPKIDLRLQTVDGKFQPTIATGYLKSLSN